MELCGHNAYQVFATYNTERYNFQGYSWKILKKEDNSRYFMNHSILSKSQRTEFYKGTRSVMLVNSCQNCPGVSEETKQDKNNKNNVIMKKKGKKRKKPPVLTYQNQPTKIENNKAAKKLLSFRVPRFLLLQ